VGGSCWDCVVPFDADIAAALAAAHELTFRQNDYWWPYDGNWGLPERPRPDSVDELWDDPVVEADGTHSVLDIVGVRGPDEEPSICEAAALDPPSRQRLFGTEEPTLADYQRARDSVWDVIEDRGYAKYTVLYRDGVPDEIVFFGVTGD
jgi:hypothetical protein